MDPNDKCNQYVVYYDMVYSLFLTDLLLTLIPNSRA